MARKEVFRTKLKKHVARLGLTLVQVGDTATMFCNICGASWPLRSDGGGPYCLCPKGCNKPLWDADTYGFSYSETIAEALTSEQINDYFEIAFAEYLSVAPGPSETMLFRGDIAMVVWWDDHGVHFFLGTREEAREEMGRRIDGDPPLSEIRTRLRVVAQDGTIVKGRSLLRQLQE